MSSWVTRCTEEGIVSTLEYLTVTKWPDFTPEATVPALMKEIAGEKNDQSA
jgi:hypothetical protein